VPSSCLHRRVENFSGWENPPVVDSLLEHVADCRSLTLALDRPWLGLGADGQRVGVLVEVHRQHGADRAIGRSSQYAMQEIHVDARRGDVVDDCSS